MKRLLRNLAFAGLCALALLAGHVFGYALLIYRSDRIGTLDWATPGGEMLDPLYNPWLVTADVLICPMLEYRYQWSPYSSQTGYFATGGVVHVLVALFVVSLVSSVLARFLPLRFAPNKLYLAPESARKHIVRCWKSNLRRPGKWMLLACAGFAGGLAAFVIDDLLSLAKTAMFISGAAVSVPTAVWGFFSLYDGTMLILFAIGLPLVTLALSARSRILRDRGFRDQWCMYCGYPCVRPGSNEGQTKTRCPECGHDSAIVHQPTRRFQRRGLVALVLLGAVASSITLYVFAPTAVYTVAGLDASLIDPKLATHDLVQLLARGSGLGSVVRVERPDATLWIMLEEDLPDANRPSISRLHILVRSTPSYSEDQRARPIRSFVVTLMEGVKTVLDVTAHTNNSTVIEVVGPPSYVGASVYISPRSATTVVHVLHGDHPPFEEEK